MHVINLEKEKIKKDVIGDIDELFSPDSPMFIMTLAFTKKNGELRTVSNMDNNLAKDISKFLLESIKSYFTILINEKKSE